LKVSCSIFFPPVSISDLVFAALMDSLKADHGFNMDSKTVRNLLQAMSEFSTTERREFLQFVTGSPKLPIGGKFLCSNK
jgi:E3 ubiquitin-protein ligase TRIP12